MQIPDQQEKSIDQQEESIDQHTLVIMPARSGTDDAHTDTTRVTEDAGINTDTYWNTGTHKDSYIHGEDERSVGFPGWPSRAPPPALVYQFSETHRGTAGPQLRWSAVGHRGWE
jgi:hypothetical protein